MLEPVHLNGAHRIARREQIGEFTCIEFTDVEGIHRPAACWQAGGVHRSIGGAEDYRPARASGELLQVGDRIPDVLDHLQRHCYGKGIVNERKCDEVALHDGDSRIFRACVSGGQFVEFDTDRRPITCESEVFGAIAFSDPRVENRSEDRYAG